MKETAFYDDDYTLNRKELYSANKDPGICLVDRWPLRRDVQNNKMTSFFSGLFSTRTKARENKNRSDICLQQDSDVESYALSSIIFR